MLAKQGRCSFTDPDQRVEYAPEGSVSPPSQAWTSSPSLDRYAEDSEIHRLEELEHENQEVVQAEQPDQIHQVIGEALEAFSRHLRGQRRLHPLL